MIRVFTYQYVMYTHISLQDGFFLLSLVHIASALTHHYDFSYRLNSRSWLPPEEVVNQRDTHACHTGILSLVGVTKTLTEGIYTCMEVHIEGKYYVHA